MGNLHGLARTEIRRVTASSAADFDSQGHPRDRPYARAAVWMLALGSFFFLSYGFANWATSQRSNVPSIVFDWERKIPFSAWTIVPYWSTDSFYALSFFVCRTRRELNAHAKRLLAVQVASVVAFLIVPLKFTFDRPELAGLPKVLFDALGAFD
ncbi:MAG: serine/threonine protein phosphatase, partial [Bryobacteraceae bacterium]